MKHKDVLLYSYRELLSNLKKIKFIESLTLIGLPINKRKSEKIMDIDIVLVVMQPLTYSMYKQIEDIFSGVCTKYSNKTTDILYAIADGPLKPATNKEEEIFLHCVLHTKDSYSKMPLLLCKNSWQQYMPIKGKPLKKYQSFKGVSKDMLLNSSLGINHLIQLVSKDSSAFIGWEKHGKYMKWRLFPLKFRRVNERADLYFYAVLRSASNALRYVLKDNSIGIDSKMAHLFKKHFSMLNSRHIPLRFLNDKMNLRNKKLKVDVALLKKQSLSFLNELKNQILSDNLEI